jgi:hypothetical protein
MNDNPPCKFSFESWNEKVTIEKSHSDITIEEFWDTCKQLARGAGFAESSIKEYFDNETDE